MVTKARGKYIPALVSYVMFQCMTLNHLVPSGSIAPNLGQDLNARANTCRMLIFLGCSQVGFGRLREGLNRLIPHSSRDTVTDGWIGASLSGTATPSPTVRLKESRRSCQEDE